MGIRVCCPNGHKLNVKETQAGRRGVCPHCGAKFMIPGSEGAAEAESTREAIDLEGVEAEEVSWYVRPPSGGQYGPAGTEAMREWIAEDRVTGDSLVWREGWPQWVAARDVFAELGAGGEASKAADGSEPGAGEQIEPRERDEAAVRSPAGIAVEAARPGERGAAGAGFPVVADAVRPAVRARRRRRQNSVQLVVWLTTVVVLLAAVFVWVLLNR